MLEKQEKFMSSELKGGTRGEWIFLHLVRKLREEPPIREEVEVGQESLYQQNYSMEKQTNKQENLSIIIWSMDFTASYFSDFMALEFYFWIHCYISSK